MELAMATLAANLWDVVRSAWHIALAGLALLLALVDSLTKSTRRVQKAGFRVQTCHSGLVG